MFSESYFGSRISNDIFSCLENKTRPEKKSCIIIKIGYNASFRWNGDDFFLLMAFNLKEAIVAARQQIIFIVVLVLVYVVHLLTTIFMKTPFYAFWPYPSCSKHVIMYFINLLCLLFANDYNLLHCVQSGSDLGLLCHWIQIVAHNRHHYTHWPIYLRISYLYIQWI